MVQPWQRGRLQRPALPPGSLASPAESIAAGAISSEGSSASSPAAAAHAVRHGKFAALAAWSHIPCVPHSMRSLHPHVRGVALARSATTPRPTCVAHAAVGEQAGQRPARAALPPGTGHAALPSSFLGAPAGQLAVRQLELAVVQLIIAVVARTFPACAPRQGGEACQKQHAAWQVAGGPGLLGSCALLHGHPCHARVRSRQPVQPSAPAASTPAASGGDAQGRAERPLQASPWPASSAAPGFSVCWVSRDFRDLTDASAGSALVLPPFQKDAPSLQARRLSRQAGQGRSGEPEPAGCSASPSWRAHSGERCEHKGNALKPAGAAIRTDNDRHLPAGDAPSSSLSCLGPRLVSSNSSSSSSSSSSWPSSAGASAQQASWARAVAARAGPAAGAEAAGAGYPCSGR